MHIDSDMAASVNFFGGLLRELGFLEGFLGGLI